MKCEEVKKTLPLFLYGELSFDEEERLEVHIDECDSCRGSPLTRSSMRRLCGSAISSGVTIQGPSGQNVSIALQNEKTPERISRRWMSRAVMSLKIT